MLTLTTHEDLSKNEKFSILYHDIFDYPLNLAELIKWQTSKSTTGIKSTTSITSKRGFYFIEGREGLIYKRLLRKRISAKKMKIALNAARLLKLIPTVKMVGVTGSLAMENCSEESDVDLMIITQKGMPWTTRFLSYFVLCTMHYALRSPFDKNQKDKLCLNMWLDETDLVWRRRNIYTAHEIAQVIPLVNKNKTYEKFLYKNKWILRYWPNAVRIKNLKLKIKNSSRGTNIVEKLAYKLQCLYMKNKISREVITPTRAIFHPQDWGKIVLSRLTLD